MVGLTALWLPIVLASIIVFAASSVIHMMSPWHKNDYPKLPNEDAVRDALRPLAIPPGEFSVPRPASTAEMKSPEFAEKMKNGPVIMMRVFPNGPISMGKNLAQWFVYTLVISLFSGYVAGRALPPGSNYLQVFRFVGATAFAGYALALWQFSIWYGRPWWITFKSNIDGLIYAFLTAGTFGWLWPR